MPAPKKKETYSQAMERLEKIVSQIDNNELEIDELAVKIKEANEIIAFCSDKLTKADREVQKLLSDKHSFVSTENHGLSHRSRILYLSISCGFTQDQIRFRINSPIIQRGLLNTGHKQIGGGIPHDLPVNMNGCQPR